MKQYKLNEKLAKQLLDSGYAELFEIIVKESHVSPTIIAAFLTETLKALKRDGIEVEKVTESKMREIFKSINSGELVKEAAQDVFVWMSKHEGATLNNAIAELGLTTISENETKMLVNKVIAENKSLIKERGKASFGILMGIVMKTSRGRVNATLVSEILKKRLEEPVE
jgi:glutamyl-tRNA(Gln) amidotransferase subunit E